MEVYNILFNRLLSETAKQQASELHLSVGSLPVIRKDGRLLKLEGEKIIEQELLVNITSSFLEAEEQKTLAEKRELTTVKTLGGHFRFKINIYYQKNLLAVSFRLIPETVRNLDSIDLPAITADLAKLTSGLVVVAGSYGSGKTTTIGAMVEFINQQQHKRILTLENPIEMLLVSKESVIEQRLIGRDVPTLIGGLRASQQEDIDILMVADIREDFAEAIPLILDIASTNCLVFLEMTADTAVRVIEKILNCYSSAKIDSARMLCADVLAGVIVQSLLPKNGGGMALGTEILIGTSAVKSVIREGKLKQIETIIQTSGGEGMISMTQSLVNLTRAGIVNREDALAGAPRKEDFQIMVR
ncbi:MAG: ATPase, T2SS/T4P/T4SS family [Patescibacteria group bacterium]